MYVRNTSSKVKNSLLYITENCRFIETNFTIIWHTCIRYPYPHVHIYCWYQQMLNTRSKVQVLEDAFKHIKIIHNNTIKQNFLGKWSEISYLNSVSSTFNLKQNGTHIHKPFIYSFYFFTAVRISSVRGITKYLIMSEQKFWCNQSYLGDKSTANFAQFSYSTRSFYYTLLLSWDLQSKQEQAKAMSVF